MRPRALAALLALSLLPCSAPPAAAQFVANGSFETSPAVGPTSTVVSVPAGGTALTGWTVGGGSVNIVTQNYWIPLAGQRSVALTGTPAYIEQSFPTSPGGGYRLTFWMSGEPFSTPVLKHLRATAAAAVGDFTFDITPAWAWDMFWTQKTLDFTATSATTTIRLQSMDASPWGPALDSVRVDLVTTDVPAGAPLHLSRVTPDPARGRARVGFSLAVAARVRLAIFDVQGRERARLLDGDLGAGAHTVGFDAAQWGGAPGLYLAVLETAGQRLVRRFTVLR